MSTNTKTAVLCKTTIGYSIWKAIETSGYSREYLAQRLGVSLRTINYWQEGKKQPSITRVIVLAQLLDCSLDNLLLT